MKPAPFKPSSKLTRQPQDSGDLVRADALAFLKGLRDSVADIVFLDPPFNLGKIYGPGAGVETFDRDTYDHYMRTVLFQCRRILRRGGALYLYHLPAWAMQWGAAIEEHLELRHWIAISMKNGFARGNRLYPAHYALLYFTKGEPLVFKRPRLELRRCPHCKKVLKDYGGYRHLVAHGVNLTDVWDDLSPVRHGTTKLRATNQLPIEITDRVCAISGRRGGLLVDPFVGTGTSLVSAIKSRMRFVANDIEQSNLDICIRRLEAVNSAKAET